MRRKNKRHETKASPEKSPEKPSRRSSRHSRRRRKSSSSPEKEDDAKAAVSVALNEVVVKPAGSISPEPATEVIGKNASLGHIEEPSSSKKHSSGALEEDKLVVKSADIAEKEWKEDKSFWESGTEKPAEASSENKEKGDGGVWKVQSANGAGGEIQKLKICRSFLSKEISSPKRKSGRSHRDSSQKGTEESSDCDEHSQSEGSETKTKHRTRTRTVSQSSPTLQDSPKVVCDVSEEKPTKIKIHLGSRSPEKAAVANLPMSENDVIVAMVEQVVEEEVIVASEEVQEMNDIVEKEEVTIEMSQDNNDQEGEQNSKDDSQKVNSEVVIDADSIQNIELPSELPVEKVNSLTSSPRIEKEQPADSEGNTTEDSDSGSNSDDNSDESSSKKKNTRRKSGMMSTVSRQKPSDEQDQPQGTESGKEEPEEDRTTQEEEGARGAGEEQQRDREESVKESPSDVVDKENVAESSRASSPGPTEPVVRKRRWGASKSIRPAKKPVLCISTDSLKNLIPEAKPVPIEEVRLSVEEETEHIDDMEEDQPDEKKEVSKEVTKKKDKDRKKEKERLKEKEEVDEKIERDLKPERPSTDGMKVNRRICVLSEDDRKLARSPSPPRHRPSDVLFITNLVRPFTIPQLKNLLARTGKIAENGFWIDKIKSKCYVQYSDVEEAIETRHALHGVRWPVSNPRTLCVEFAAYDDMAVAQALSEETDVPRKSEPLQMDHSVEGWIADQARLKLDRPQRRVREWDVGKPAHPDEALDQLQPTRPDFEDLRDRERRIKKEKGRRSRTPDAHEQLARKQRRKDEDAPAKLLDDLFRKTKVHPCIYWLPLTAEQIVVKEEMRRQHMAEHERRIAEMKKAELSRRDRERRSRK